MTVKAAKEEALGVLHARVAQVMTGALDVFDHRQKEYLQGTHDDMEAPEVNASLLSVITKFLADNKITCVPEESKEVSELAERLKNKRRRVGNVVHLVQED